VFAGDGRASRCTDQSSARAFETFKTCARKELLTSKNGAFVDYYLLFREEALFPSPEASIEIKSEAI
jgi:hypothetical protein